MIDSNNMEEEVYSPNDLYIAFGVTFLGTINVPGTAQINGSVTGELTSNILNIGPQGYFKGKVRAKEIDVAGTLMENIECEGLLKIRKTGKVFGQLFYADLDIERGGQFEGQMVNSSK